MELPAQELRSARRAAAQPPAFSRHSCSCESRPAGVMSPRLIARCQADATSSSSTHSSQATRPRLAPPASSNSATTSSTCRNETGPSIRNEPEAAPSAVKWGASAVIAADAPPRRTPPKLDRQAALGAPEARPPASPRQSYRKLAKAQGRRLEYSSRAFRALARVRPEPPRRRPLAPIVILLLAPGEAGGDLADGAR